jgi:hypothetical protein
MPATGMRRRRRSTVHFSRPPKCFCWRAGQVLGVASWLAAASHPDAKSSLPPWTVRAAPRRPR